VGGKGDNPCPGIFPFRGRDVGAVTPAAFLAKNAGLWAGMPSGVTTSSGPGLGQIMEPHAQ